MNICEAAKLAIAQKAYIVRAEFADHLMIQPTNTESYCMISRIDGMHRSPRWQPSLEDLIADDWTVFDQEEKQDELV